MESQPEIPEKLISYSEASEALAHLLWKASLGDLTASLLHEINNPVTAILNYGRLLQIQHFQPEEVESFAKNIVAEGERIAELAYRVARLARTPAWEEHRSKLQDALSLALRLYETGFRHDGIVVEMQSAAALPDTNLPLKGLMQIILPLLEQARQALNSRGSAHEADKILRCGWREINPHGKNAQRLTLSHNGMSPDSTLVNLFRHLLPASHQEDKNGLQVVMTQALLAKLNCKIVVERQADGWTAIHIDLPAQKQ
jgi:C4-dicarboxylate-specific signal transduction histidine kinase